MGLVSRTHSQKEIFSRVQSLHNWLNMGKTCGYRRILTHVQRYNCICRHQAQKYIVTQLFITSMLGTYSTIRTYTLKYIATLRLYIYTNINKQHALLKTLTPYSVVSFLYSLYKSRKESSGIYSIMCNEDKQKKYFYNKLNVISEIHDRCLP